MRVLVTGGTGFLGQDLVRDLLNAGHHPVLLVHESSPPRKADVEVVRGDVTDERVLAKGLAGCDAALHLATPTSDRRTRRNLEKVHVEGTEALVEAARQEDVQRLVLASVAGADPDGTATQATKARAEEIVADAGVTHTVLRLTPVAGAGGIVDAFRRLLKFFPATPILGSGEAEVAPIARTDAARAFSRVLDDATGTAHETYCLSGPERLTYREFVAAICDHFGLDRPTVTVPEGLARGSARALGLLPGAPRRADDLTALLEAGTCGDHSGLPDLGVEPTSFREALEQAYGPPETDMATPGGSMGPGMFGPGRP
jgi:NADH dehydrogenase